MINRKSVKHRGDNPRTNRKKRLVRVVRNLNKYLYSMVYGKGYMREYFDRLKER